MKVVFLVQGEGRGHLTQAISMYQILSAAGHEVVGVLIGKSTDRVIPTFFKEQLPVPIFSHDAPNIIYSKNGKGINLRKTIFTHICTLPHYIKTLFTIHNRVKELKPDLIINFYEIYGGLYNILFRNETPMIGIAHQYLLQHPDFTFPPNSTVDRNFVAFNTKTTSWLVSKKLALSFRPMANAVNSKLVVVPPLIRKEVRRLTPSKGDFLLVYMTHHSLSPQIIEWQEKHPEVRLECFWDNKNEAETLEINSNLTFRQINSERYLQLLATCKGLVTTAGFESVCEAMYLGKPVMMVPVPKHFEQQCNALDGVISGAGVSAKGFDLSIMLDYLPRHQDQSARFRNWYMQGENMFLNEIEALGNGTVCSPKLTPSQKPSASLLQ